MLVGFGTLDDAGVYALGPEQALVQTVDFITPLVDDPFAFGQIAAANSLSDVYAMGGNPITALNVVCFPSGADPNLLREILRGGLSKFAEAGVALLGGHTVDDAQIKYGASVTGLVHPERIWTNAGACVGDILILTKPLGTGVVSSAVKLGTATEASMQAALVSMTTLNKSARDVLASFTVHACTDVTGFGLMGHLSHMVRASGVTAQITAQRVPLLPGALNLARAGVGPGGTARNRAHFGPNVSLASSLEEALMELLFDPQTSGGLMASVPGENEAALLAEFAARGIPAARIGEIVSLSKGRIVVA